MNQFFMAGTAPPLSNRETDYKFGYASLVVTGSQRVFPVPGAPSVPEHLAVLELLVSRGLPVSLPDIAGYTALHHAVSGTPRVSPEIIRKLITSGADLNYRDRWGSTPLHRAIADDHITGIDLLMEHGASVDLPDGNGLTVRLAYIPMGKAVTAAIEKWRLKRSGKAQAPMTGKMCDQCGTRGKSLRNCSGCLTARYCSRECQREPPIFTSDHGAHCLPIGQAWKAHKLKCKTFTESSSVTLKPFYPGPRGWLCPNEPLMRGLAGKPPTKPVPGTHLSLGHFPANFPPGGKQAIVKIQVPATLKDLDGNYRPMLVYTQKRDFSCTLQREDGQKEWDTLYDVVRKQTVSALKGYFIVDIKSRDKLVVKVSEPLATQPW